jgi:aspartate/methionine/tyrosine aminotransferase
MLKKKIISEYEEDRFYTSYTDHCGSRLFLAAVYCELKELDNLKIPKLDPQKNICRTIGATGALSSVIEYLGSRNYVRKALVLGLNYSLFTLWCEKHNIKYHIKKSDVEDRILPTVEEAIDGIRLFEPDLIILTQPTNPSGEVYFKDELKEIVDEAIKRDIWFLYDDVPNLYNIHDNLTPVNIFEVIEQETYPEKIIFVNSFSKSRSLAGLRFGYVVCNQTIYDYLYHYNDQLFWSPQHVASSALAKDIVLRTMLRKTKSVSADKRQQSIDRTVRRFSHTIKLLSPYADDMSMLEDNFMYIKPQTTWEDDLIQYEAELLNIYNIYNSNWQKAVSELQPYMSRIIPGSNGFNHCFTVNSSLKEGEFCIKLFDETGIDVYTESVFAEDDNLDRKDYFIRLSCAIQSDSFESGLERLSHFFKKYCDKVRG